MSRIPDKFMGNMNTRSEGEVGVWLAAGHGPWRISMSVGTGKVMADMIQGKSPSVDITKLKL